MSTQTQLQFADIKAGDRLIADGGFTCLKDGEVVTVVADEDGDLYVPCSHVRHFLDGQEAEDGSLIGLARAVQS